MLQILLLFAMLVQPSPSQTVRGRIVDASTSVELTGVTILLRNSDPLIGTISDLDGRFVMNRVPVGRQTFVFTYVGYEPVEIRDIVVTSGKEIVLDIRMRESVTSLGEVVVTPDVRKEEAANRAALSSARLLSMEEASRYAGGFDDPARLAMAFAGASGSLSTNAIVIRGNAPKGLLWRMEGVDIPTPSHFNNLLDFGGGGITALSSRMLADSDFMTGAFPAEYGNALSGVFDLKLRRGNTETYENSIAVGTIGLDWASEGPLGRGGSYLFNYRYSTFALMGSMLPEDAQKIRYQNLSAHVSHPIGRNASVSIWGIGATDKSGTIAEADSMNRVFDQDMQESDTPTYFGVMGMEFRTIVKRRGTWRLSASATGQGLDLDVKQLDTDGQLQPHEFIVNRISTRTIGTSLDWRWMRGLTQKSGVTFTNVSFEQDIRQNDIPITAVTGSTRQIQMYSQARWDLGQWVLSGGIHSMHSSMSGERTFEPRAGIEWLMTTSTRMNVSYGRHSQVEPLSIRMAHAENRKLRSTKADHWVAGVKQSIGRNHMVSVEIYSQSLFDVPVIADSSFSTVNLELDWFFKEPLVNDGEGRNKGVDVSVERYLNRGWYYLISGSLFTSSYHGGDGVWRDTRFNRGDVMNVLIGKEWTFGAGHAKMFGLNSRFTTMGGKRYSPVRVQESIDNKDIVYDENQAFERQEPRTYYVDLTVQFRVSHRASSSMLSVQLNNLTGHKDFYGHRYNHRTGGIDIEKEALIIPNIQYVWSF